MSIKQQGGIFGRNPTFNDVTVDGTLTVNGEPISDFGTMAQQDANNVNIDGGAIDGTAIGATTPSTVKASTFITYGNLLINRDTVATGAAIETSYAGGSAEYGMEFRPTTDDTIAILFKAAAGGTVGSITQTASATAYNTSSDYRLKEDVQAMVGASDRLMALKPVNFAWKVDGSRVDGFLAHEAQEVVPEAVTGKKDAVDKDGNPEYQGIDQSKIVPLLVAALQDALARIEALEAK